MRRVLPAFTGFWVAILLLCVAAKPALPPVLVDIPDDATAQNDDFGTTGLLTDVIAESTAAAGVTIDGLKIKDSGIDMSGLATGVGYLALKDNAAAAYSIKEGSNPYQVYVTTNGSESAAYKVKLTTTNGVSSGAARVVGGVHTINTTPSTAIDGTNENPTSFDQGCSLEATALNRVGAILRVRVQGLTSNMGASDNAAVLFKFNNTSMGGTGTFTPADEAPWVVSVVCTTVATGSSGTLICGGQIDTKARASNSAPDVRSFYSGATTTSTTTFDLTGAISVTVGWDWAASANDADSVRQDFIMCEIIG